MYEENENLKECSKCAAIAEKKEFHHGWCKLCWRKYVIKTRFLEKLKNVDPIKCNEIVLHYFETVDQEEIREQLQNMSDDDIKTILNNILKNKIPINQEYFKNRYKKNYKVLNK